MEHAKEVIVYTDGSCLGNPGPGGWAAILRYGEVERVLTGSQAQTTNNRMELQATIEALTTLKRTSCVRLTTDSQYVRMGITQWIHGWKKNGWRRADKKPVKNADLWQQLDTLAAKHDVTWCWVKAHNGDAMNERVDQLAYQAAKEVRT